VYVCVYARAHMCVCVCVCVRARARARVRMQERGEEKVWFEGGDNDPVLF
jgi:hypothetical protein